jgi:hypothetical protein
LSFAVCMQEVVDEFGSPSVQSDPGLDSLDER